MSEESTLPDEMNPEKTDAVVLKHSRLFCALHGEPFRSQWPKGFVIAMVKGFQMFTAIDGVWDEARRLHGLGADIDLIPKHLEIVMDARPICCRIARTLLLELYKETGIGTMARCKICGRKSLGTPYEATNLGKLKHLCFDCVVTASATPQGVH